MIKNILELLKYVNGETRSDKNCTGQIQTTLDFKDGYKTIKNNIKWR
jgi:hypothetical protein